MFMSLNNLLVLVLGPEPEAWSMESHMGKFEFNCTQVLSMMRPEHKLEMAIHLTHP